MESRLLQTPIQERPVRLGRSQRKERTRTEVLQSARRVFLARGFHEASLEEIAEEAGYTKGAVYSSFASKDELFLAVLDEHIDRRLQAYEELIPEAPTLEEGLRVAGRYMAELDAREPAWQPLMVEFWIHAARREPLRLAARERHERATAAITALIAKLAARHDVEYRIPDPHLVRGSGALARGMALERLIDPAAAPVELVEEMFVAYCLGLAMPRRPASEPGGAKRR